MLGEYAARFIINKDGYAAELSRINHYVMAVGLPRLNIRIDTEGRCHLQTLPGSESPTVPPGSKRESTNA